MKISRFIIMFLFFLSCQTDSKKLFWISDSTESASDLLFLVESTNIPELPIDSLDYFLDWDEVRETGVLESRIESIEDLQRPITYKNFGLISETDSCRVFVLLRINNKSDYRDYKFIIRTYKPNMDIIDSYDLAVWNKRDDKYCFGSINSKLIIEKRCKDSEYPEIMQIAKDGKIIMTSFHKP